MNEGERTEQPGYRMHERTASTVTKQALWQLYCTCPASDCHFAIKPGSRFVDGCNRIKRGYPL